MTTEKITERESHFDQLEKMTVKTLLENINKEDSGVASVLQAAIPQIESLVVAALGNLKAGGRLFYIGAGTSGRLGVLDAAECPQEILAVAARAYRRSPPSQHPSRVAMPRRTTPYP